MTDEEMNRRIKEAINQTGDRTTGIVANLLGRLIFDLREWNINGHNNLDEMELSIGSCYVALKMLEQHVHADPDHVQKGAEDVLSYT